MTGTVPRNFPPNTSLDIGAIVTGSSLGNTAALPSTVFFTAPVAGLYAIAVAVRIVETDGTGTLALSVITPNAGTLTMTTPDEDVPSVSVIKNALTSGGGVDGFMAAVPCWMDQGETVRVAVAVGSLTGTTFNVYTSAQKLL